MLGMRDVNYHAYGLSICPRSANNREEAVEILNDAFLKAFTYLDQYDTNCEFKPWLRRILINSAINYHRKLPPGVRRDHIGADAFLPNIWEIKRS